jgi:hypothetical protein
MTNGLTASLLINASSKETRMEVRSFRNAKEQQAMAPPGSQVFIVMGKSESGFLRSSFADSAGWEVWRCHAESRRTIVFGVVPSEGGRYEPEAPARATQASRDSLRRPRRRFGPVHRAARECMVGDQRDCVSGVRPATSVSSLFTGRHGFR